MQNMTKKEGVVEKYLRANEENTTMYRRSDRSRQRGANLTNTFITEKEIKAIINSFKNNTPGERNINETVFKNIPERFISTLQSIFNYTLSLGYFQTKFKTALIKLIPKANSDDTDPKNYRPISLLDCQAKSSKR